MEVRRVPSTDAYYMYNFWLYLGGKGGISGRNGGGKGGIGDKGGKGGRSGDSGKGKHFQQPA